MADTERSRPKITLYVDVVSPFAYLGYYMLRHHPIFSPSNVEITFVPIFLGGLMKQCNNITPINITNKGTYIDRERRRWITQFNIPMRETFPDGFPMGTPTLNVQRFLTALNMTRPEYLVPALDEVYAAFWNPSASSSTRTRANASSGTTTDDETKTEAEALKVWEPRVLADLLKRNKVVSASVVDECLSKMATGAVKAELSAKTQQAFEDGAFGLPWFQCEDVSGHKEGFWGFDHIGQVVRFLDLKKRDRNDDDDDVDGTVNGAPGGELKPLL